MNTEEILNQFKDLDELKELYLEYVDKLELKIGVRSLELFIKDIFLIRNKVDKEYKWFILDLYIKDEKVFKYIQFLENNPIHEVDTIFHILYCINKYFKEATNHIKQQLNESIRTNI